MTTQRTTLAALVLVALAAAACSDSPAGRLPTAPTALANPAASTTDAAATLDRSNVVTDGALIKEWAKDSDWVATDGFEVQGTDVITAATGTCPSVVITVRAVPVTVTASTTFGTGASCAGLTVNRRITVRGLLTYTAAGGYAVTAASISFPELSEAVSGTVATVTGTCPSLTIALSSGGTITTSSSTSFTPTACSTIVAGARIEANGPRNTTTGQLVADSIEVEDLPVEGSGVVSAVTGTCPSLSITITGGTTVTTSASTTFDPANRCPAVAAGATIEVAGLRSTASATAPIVASRVEVERVPVVHTGRVTAVAGTCPAITITFDGGTTAVTSATTRFSPTGSCASIAVGATVQVTGTRAGSGAGSITVTDAELQGSPLEGEGRVVSVTGTCPAITIVLDSGVPVVTTSSTAFQPTGSCSQITAGTRIWARGTRNAVGQVTATDIRIIQEVRRHVNGESTLTALSGTCPALTMTIAGYRVVADAQTQFVNGACSTLRVGSKLYVEGYANTDGSVTATLVRVTEHPANGGGGRVAGEGRIDSVTGSCPSLTLSVRGYTVTTSATTTYVGGTCASLAAQANIEASGVLTGRTLAADTIRIISTRGH